MGKRETLQKRVTAALNRIGNLAVDITVTKVTKSAFDIPSDDFTKSNTEFTVKSFPSNFSEQKRTTRKIKDGDLEFLFSAELLDFTPEVKDVFETEAGNNFEIVALEGVPSAETAVMWKLQMRPTI